MTTVTIIKMVTLSSIYFPFRNAYFYKTISFRHQKSPKENSNSCTLINRIVLFRSKYKADFKRDYYR
jgi:hypothetical protein